MATFVRTLEALGIALCVAGVALFSCWIAIRGDKTERIDIDFGEAR